MSDVTSPTDELLSAELLHQLERMELVSRKIFRGRMKGERRSRRKGQSVEFADFRGYVPGDDLRFIDWNLYARLDRLFLKLFLEEEDLHFYALIDASGSMDFGQPTKFQYSKQLAAALGFIGLCRADRVRIETLSSRDRKPGPVLRGRRNLWRMLDYLNSIEANDNTPLEEGVKNFCLRNSGNGIVVLISDLMDKSGYESAFRYLIAQQMDVYVVHLLSPEEVRPAVKGDLRLVDCEDADETEITASRPLLARYERTLAAFVEGAREFCHDVAQNWLLHAVLCLHWMNPFAWLAVSRLRSERETVRDFGVLGRTPGASYRDYGRTILRIVESSSPLRAGAARVAIRESNREVKRKIAMLAKSDGRQPRGLLTGTFLAIALILTTLVGASVRPTLAASGPEKALTGRLATPHFEVRYRPGSRAGAAAERDAARAERDFKDICEKLEFTPTDRFTMNVYDDAGELQLVAGVGGVGAFSSGLVTHVPQGDDQTRYHEIAHLVTARLPKTGKEERNMFFPEAMANALLRHVHGVSVHAVAKFHRMKKTLPRLADLTSGDFYAWQRAHPKVSGYDIGGSFILFLFDTYGATKVKRYYTGTAAGEAFGLDVGKLEAAWQKSLDGYVLRPEVETLLRQRWGDTVKFTVYTAEPEDRLPAELLGKPKDWRSLVAEKLRPQDDATWKREGVSVKGTGEGAGWHIALLGTRKYGDCVVRARIQTENIMGGVQIRLGPGCCAMLVGNGTFVWSNDRGIAMSPQEKVRIRGEVDFTMVRKAGRLRVYVNGALLTEGAVDRTPNPVGIGFHCGQGRGTARFTNVSVRALP